MFLQLLNNTNCYTLCCVILIIIYDVCTCDKIVENFDSINTEAINMISSIYNNEKLVTDSVMTKSITIDRSSEQHSGMMTLVGGDESPYINFNGKNRARIGYIQQRPDDFYISKGKLCVGDSCLTSSEINKLKRLLSLTDSNINALKQLDYTNNNITTEKPIHIQGNALYVTDWAGWSSEDHLGPYPNNTARYGGANEDGYIYNGSKGVNILHTCGPSSCR